MAIHGCGTGLSAIPGLRCLIGAGHDVAVWAARYLSEPDRLAQHVKLADHLA